MARTDFSGRQVGPYLLTDILGEGSAASVYRAVHTASIDSTSFAVKCLRKSKSQFRFIPEVIHQDSLTGCPHVLTLRDIVQDDRYLFLVLDLCDTNMYSAIRKNRAYWRDDALIRKVFVQLLDGISACHERNIFHRDLKPENIMCKSDGTDVRIADFGLATHHRVARDGGCGTPNYMSPECWMNEEGEPYFSFLADIWSLGVILFNMVTNREPWQAALFSDMEFKAFMDDEDHLFHTSPISRQLNDLLKWILHPIPHKRLMLPVIRRAVVEMDTFYKKRPRLASCLPSPNGVVFTDPEQTCVEPSDALEDKQKYAAVLSSTI